MKEKPILFSGPMVRAILDGRKSQTRRVVNPQPPKCVQSFTFTCDDGCWWENDPGGFGPSSVLRGHCHFGVPGDRLWVREAWAVESVLDCHSPRDIEPYAPVWHCADATRPADGGVPLDWGRTRPSIYMPRWASRLTLEVVSVRVERVQDISEADAVAEGVGIEIDGREGLNARAHFASTWDAINGKRGFGWDANPWVWAVEFKATT